jgi:hypothetical protein
MFNDGYPFFKKLPTHRSLITNSSTMSHDAICLVFHGQRVTLRAVPFCKGSRTILKASASSNSVALAVNPFVSDYATHPCDDHRRLQIWIDLGPASACSPQSWWQCLLFECGSVQDRGRRFGPPVGRSVPHLLRRGNVGSISKSRGSMPPHRGS